MSATSQALGEAKAYTDVAGQILELLEESIKEQESGTLDTIELIHRLTGLARVVQDKAHTSIMTYHLRKEG